VALAVMSHAFTEIATAKTSAAYAVVSVTASDSSEACSSIVTQKKRSYRVRDATLDALAKHVKNAPSGSVTSPENTPKPM
jgi:hypothetical protein